MKNLPFVSILVPTTPNRLKFLTQLFKYIKKQDYLGKKEIIVLNDGTKKLKNIPIQDSTQRNDWSWI